MVVSKFMTIADKTDTCYNTMVCFPLSTIYSTKSFGDETVGKQLVANNSSRAQSIRNVILLTAIKDAVFQTNVSDRGRN